MAAERPDLATELQEMLDASPDAILIVDRGGTIVALNGRTETLFATTAEQLKGKPVESLVPPRLREVHAAERSAYARAPTVRPMSARRGLMGRRSDDTEFEVEVSLTPVIGSAEGLVMAVVRPVVAPEVQEALERTDRAADALDAIADPILTTDAGGRVDFLNRAAERLTGWTREAARGRLLADVLPVQAESGGPATIPGEVVLPAVPGRDGRTLDVSTTPMHDRLGAPAGVAVVARDVTHARLLARQLAHQATHDPLTGLVNRGEFERRLERALAGTGDEHAEHALCFLDLDGFKRVNDACGHEAGDELLRQLTDLMRERMRSRDTLARLGGDEFGLLLEHCRLPRARRIATVMRDVVRAHRFTCGDETYAVGVSIGIAPLRAGAGRAADVLRVADRACYAAKRGGGNRIKLGEALGPVAEPDPDWVRRVLEAVEGDRFRLHAQPMLRLGGAHPASPYVETLLRLVVNDDEMLAPGTCLPAARRAGLMPTVDRWVIRHAIGRLAEWRRAHPSVEPPAIAINLDDDSVTEGEVPDLVRRELAATGVPAQALCFEIGESVAAARAAACARLVRELREAGCRVTLERCGAGAAFTLLRRLPVDYLKIDGEVVRRLSADPVDRALAAALTQAAHAIGAATIGAGAEREEDLACLRQVGVDFAQGYAVGRPGSLPAVLAEAAGLTPARRPAPSSARSRQPRPS